MPKEKNNDDFFPEGYEAPVDISSFMKLEDGDNTFRILSKAVTGYEYWNTENKPKRSKVMWDVTPSDIRLEKDGKQSKVKHFWSFLVWNYKLEAVQELEITQSTVMKAIKALVDNTKWGNPTKYDITVNKTGKELLTKYSVVPNPHSEITPEMQKALDETQIDLEEIFKD